MSVNPIGKRYSRASWHVFASATRSKGGGRSGELAQARSRQAYTMYRPWVGACKS